MISRNPNYPSLSENSDRCWIPEVSFPFLLCPQKGCFPGISDVSLLKYLSSEELQNHLKIHLKYNVPNIPYAMSLKRY